MTAEQYAYKLFDDELTNPVLSFQLKTVLGLSKYFQTIPS